MKKSIAIAGIAGFLAAAGAVQADTLRATYHFAMFTNNQPVNGGAAGAALTMNVWDVMASSSQVAFEFLWDPVAYGSADEWYWDDDAGLLAGIASNGITTSATEFYDELTGSFNVPAWNNIRFGDEANPPNPNPLEADFGVEAHNVNAGVNNVGEWLRVVFDLNSMASVDDVLAALQLGANNYNVQDLAGSMRVASHVQQMGEGGLISNGFVIVPLPPAAWAGLASLAGVCGFAYIRRRSFVH